MEDTLTFAAAREDGWSGQVGLPRAEWQAREGTVCSHAGVPDTQGRVLGSHLPGQWPALCCPLLGCLPVLAWSVPVLAVCSSWVTTLRLLHNAAQLVFQLSNICQTLRCALFPAPVS